VIDQTREMEELKNDIKQKRLKGFLEDRYDTLTYYPEDTYTTHVLFVRPVGQSDERGNMKYYASTNMTLHSSLGYPFKALWRYIRLYFEKYENVEDVMLWAEKARIQLQLGQNTVFWGGSVGSMEPMAPDQKNTRLGRLMGRLVHNGHIKIWPWLQAHLSDCVIDSTTSFEVHVCYAGKVDVKHPVRVKISLGPWIFRP
jgi:hypothetical protein